MSVDTSHATARFSALVIDRQHCCSAQCLSALHLASCASPKHSISRRSIKPDLPIEHPQSQDPCALTASAISHATVKSP
jgi:hypothetical protein